MDRLDKLLWVDDFLKSLRQFFAQLDRLPIIRNSTIEEFLSSAKTGRRSLDITMLEGGGYHIQLTIWEEGHEKPFAKLELAP